MDRGVRRVLHSLKDVVVEGLFITTLHLSCTILVLVWLVRTFWIMTRQKLIGRLWPVLPNGSLRLCRWSSVCIGWSAYSVPEARGKRWFWSGEGICDSVSCLSCFSADLCTMADSFSWFHPRPRAGRGVADLRPNLWGMLNLCKMYEMWTPRCIEIYRTFWLPSRLTSNEVCRRTSRKF